MNAFGALHNFLQMVPFVKCASYSTCTTFYAHSFHSIRWARTDIVIVQELGSGSKEMCFDANAFCWNECF